MLSENLLRGLWAMIAMVLAVSLAAQSAPQRVRGQLAAPEAGEPLRLVTQQGESIELVTARDLESTMRDPQLANRTWELRGVRLEDSRFAVERVFTVKDGQIHRVTYYCEICHITTHEPGPCMCCQGDTDLREIPGE